MEQVYLETIEESDCSDCGRVVGPLSQFYDEQTCSEVYLCPGCAVAFQSRMATQQRQVLDR
jgi:hypothetical protein